MIEWSSDLRLAEKLAISAMNLDAKEWSAGKSATSGVVRSEIQKLVEWALDIIRPHMPNPEQITLERYPNAEKVFDLLIKIQNKTWKPEAA